MDFLIDTFLDYIEFKEVSYFFTINEEHYEITYYKGKLTNYYEVDYNSFEPNYSQIIRDYPALYYLISFHSNDFDNQFFESFGIEKRNNYSTNNLKQQSIFYEIFPYALEWMFKELCMICINHHLTIPCNNLPLHNLEFIQWLCDYKKEYDNIVCELLKELH